MAVAVDQPQQAQRPAPPRRLRSMLSAGHVLMITSGLLAALLTFSVLRQQDQTWRVAIAGADAPAGVPLDPSSVRYVDVALPEGVLATLIQPHQSAELAGVVTGTSFQEGQLITRPQLRTVRGGRTMSFPIAPANAAGGAIEAGDRVDIVSVRDGVSQYVATGTEVIEARRGASEVGAESLLLVVALDETTALRLASAVQEEAVQVVRVTGAPPADPAGLYDPGASGSEGSPPETGGLPSG